MKRLEPSDERVVVDCTSVVSFEVGREVASDLVLRILPVPLAGLGDDTLLPRPRL